MEFSRKIALLAILTMMALPACAVPNRDFTFSFGMPGDNPGIEILNYRYGTSTRLPVSPPDWALAAGHISQGTAVSATFPPGDILYVKWRILSTGKIYEDTVDLKNSLPSDMNNLNVYFSIIGPQLYVYLISDQGHLAGGQDCPAKPYKHFKGTTLYPVRYSNF